MSFFMPSAGPLANDIKALEILCRSVGSVRPALYDSSAIDIPWRDISKTANTGKLRIGVLSEDPCFPWHPPVKRTMAHAEEGLKAQGHEIYRIDPSVAQVGNSLALAFAYFFLDSTAMEFIAQSGEELVASVKQSMGEFHAFKSNFLDDIAHLEGVVRVAALNTKREAIREGWRRVWKEQKLDVVIGPPAQHSAVPHDTYGLPPYTLMLNVLDVSGSISSIFF